MTEETPSRPQRQRLTKRLVEQLEPNPDRYFIVWDSDIPGFGIRIWPSGKRVYIFKYRNLRGTQRKVAIGPHGPITAERARKIASDMFFETRKGNDPAARKLEAREAPTVEDLAKRYMTEHAEIKKKPSSVKSDEALLRLHILPRLGRLTVQAVDRAHIQKLHHDMRETPGAANRTLALFSKMFNLAEKWGLRQDGTNPCRHVERYPERRLERFLSNEELGHLSEALAEAERTRMELPAVLAAVRLLLFTGCRLSEILTLRWDQVDFENQRLQLAESKTGARFVYLSPPALEVLNGLERKEGNPFVITGAKRGAHLINLRKPWGRIRKKAGLENVRLHDLRHSFASVAVAGGLSLPLIGALLGHSQPQTTARYAHLADDPLRQAANLIGGRIAAAMAQGAHRKSESAT